MTVYDWFNNPFTVDCGSPDLYLPPMPIGDSLITNKRDLYTPDLLPCAIYADSGKSVSTLTDPSDPPKCIPLTSDAPGT